MRIASIHVYPVKSCRGIDLQAAQVTPRGIENDRRWMIVDAGGAFLTQRAHPRMALIGTALSPELLTLCAEGHGSVEVPRNASGEPCDVVVWDDRVPAMAVSAPADAWLSDVLGLRCRLVFMPDAVRRPVDPRYADRGDHVSFADAFPLLIATTASLEDLNARLAVPLPMNRFRPNVVVEGTSPFAEDSWSSITFGDVALRVVKPCARCAITTTDQATAVRGDEPLRTLAGYRKQDGKVMFGQNAIPSATGELRVGMHVAVGS